MKKIIVCLAMISAFIFLGIQTCFSADDNPLNIQDIIEQKSETSVVINLISEETLKGGEIKQKNWGTVNLHSIKIQKLPSSQTKKYPVPPEESKYNVYSLLFPVTFNPLKHDYPITTVSYEKADLTVSLPEEVYSLELTEESPPSGISPEKVTTQFTINPKFKENGIGSIQRTVEYTATKRVITSFGTYSSNFRWQFDAQSGMNILGDYQCKAVVAVPKGLKKLPINVSIEADIAYRMFGMLKIASASNENPYKDTIPLE